MKLAALSLLSLGSLLSLVQQTPAPVNALIPIIYGSVAGGFAGKFFSEVMKIKGRDSYATALQVIRAREDDPFAGLPQPAADQCKGQLNDVTVMCSPAGDDGIRVDNVPSSCMTLANVFLGTDPQQPAPTPMGSSSLEYHGLSTDQIQQLQSALDTQQ